MSMFTSKRWAVLPCAAVAVALIASGCSSDDSGSSDSSSAPDVSVLGPENKAAGEPVKVAFAWTGKNAAAYTEELSIAEATVKYVNDHLGGINGRPMELSEICEDQIQVSLARECANKFVQSDAVVTITGEAGTSDTIASITSPSGMPYLNVTGGGQQSLTLPNTYVLGNPLAGLVGVPAAYAKEEGFKKVAILAIDSPNAIEPLKTIGPLAFGNAGAQLDVVAIPPGSADMTPQVQAALQNDPDMFHILGDVPFCVAALKAMRTLNATQPVMSISQCIGDSEAAEQIPGGYADLLVAPGRNLDPAAEETKIFEAVLQKYGVTTGESGATAYMAVRGLQSALDGMEGEITRATVAARLGAMPEPEPYPLTPGSTFQCGSKPVAIAPNICTPDALIAKAEEDGTIVDVRSIDVSSVFAMPGV